MSTINRGYPFPPNGDVPTNVPADVAALANALDGDLGALLGSAAPDASGSLTLATGSGTADWTRVGRLVVVRFDNTRTLAVGATTIVASGGLPAAVRPVGSDAFGTAWLDGNYVGAGIVNVAGAVAIAHQTGASRTRGVGTVTYLVDIA